MSGLRKFTSIKKESDGLFEAMSYQFGKNTIEYIVNNLGINEMSGHVKMDAMKKLNSFLNDLQSMKSNDDEFDRIKADTKHRSASKSLEYRDYEKVGVGNANFYEEGDGIYENAKIKTEADFKEYAIKMLKKAHGDDFKQNLADEFIKNLIKKHKKDWGAMIGVLKSSLNESTKNCPMTYLFTGQRDVSNTNQYRLYIQDNTGERKVINQIYTVSEANQFISSMVDSRLMKINGSKILDRNNREYIFTPSENLK